MWRALVAGGLVLAGGLTTVGGGSTPPGHIVDHLADRAAVHGLTLGDLGAGAGALGGPGVETQDWWTSLCRKFLRSCS